MKHQTTGGRTLIKKLGLSHFRNLSEVFFEPAPRLNLIFGDNGHGKTSLIEALYVLATTRSFRSNRLFETVQEGQERARIQGKVESFGLERELRAGISARGRSFLIDGKKPKRNVEYALKTPVIAFHPGDLLLVSGPATHRRTLLDRVIFYLDPGGASARLNYQKAVRDRQKLLTTRGAQAVELDVYEQVIARHGVRFQQARKRAAEAVMETLGPAFSQMASPELVCRVEYEMGGTIEEDGFLRELASRRQKDLLRGAATFGPQKDELHLSVDGRAARSHASQGQQRLATLAIKMAELRTVREVTGMEPILLLDDVSSELDPSRTRAVFDLLQSSKSQIFVTTTRPELFSEVQLEPGERADFQVQNGAVQNRLK